MQIPISWLEEYVKIKLDLKNLMWKMTEVGMTTESYSKVGKNIVLDVEVTPNRPDWLSILGTAREIGAIQNSQVTPPKISSIPKKTADLPIDTIVNPKLCSRYTAITVKGVEVKDSPLWMQDYLRLVGLRPINNLVDITNFVMFELGIPIHVFDYDKFDDKKLIMQMSQGGEEFVSVDAVKYKLPENAIIIKDKKRVIDLCGIKGGKNTSIDKTTKNIYIHVPVYTPEMIRKTSQKLKLSSDASYIYERGTDPGGSLNTLQRVVNLILEHSGGKIASEVIDKKQHDFVPKQLILDKQKLDQVLGVEISIKKASIILKNLNFQPKINNNSIVCTVPTYRQDINISEDLIEEVARMYGYNNFPKTLPISEFNTNDIPYKYDFAFEQSIKQLMKSAGYQEVMNLSIISEKTIIDSQLPLDTHIKLANPVSKEYEYMRISLMPGLLNALKINKDIENLQLYEYGKTFIGPVDTREEIYMLSGISNIQDFRTAKGVIDFILDRLNITGVDIKTSKVENGVWHPNKSAVIEKGNQIIGSFGYIHPKVLYTFDISADLFGFELDMQTLKSLARPHSFMPISKYPSQIEDLTIEPPKNVQLLSIINEIKNSSNNIESIELVEIYNNRYTLRIKYHHKGKTLTDTDIKKLREKIIVRLEKQKILVDN